MSPKFSSFNALASLAGSLTFLSEVFASLYYIRLKNHALTNLAAQDILFAEKEEFSTAAVVPFRPVHQDFEDLTDEWFFSPHVRQKAS